MSITKTALLHGVVSFVLFAFPFVLNLASPYENVTIGAVLNALYHWVVGYAQS